LRNMAMPVGPPTIILASARHTNGRGTLGNLLEFDRVCAHCSKNVDGDVMLPSIFAPAPINM